ncbi:ubiquinol-cytochrome-c reductase complex assembly factor 6 [Pantherophis guttatus]|uniref:Ubiquinol-cytochrome-c reductase complex assembly factor 6 n=1 Tax=Pantherophis guttatus TaxID=94885 RepID=A0A6P9ASA6_PANGU|nr:ubiquinol-cytochrome-c reductase complex assembly factor 6 [Pantherophis guttatus]
MPAGVSWPKYLKILTAAFLSMLAGAQTVHKFYKPDLTSDIPLEAGELRTEMPSLKNTNEPVQPLQPRS